MCSATVEWPNYRAANGSAGAGVGSRPGSHNMGYVNPFVRGLRSPRRLPYTSLPELLHPLTRGSAGGQTEAGDIIGSQIQQFHGYTATKLIVAELQLLQVGEVA